MKSTRHMPKPLPPAYAEGTYDLLGLTHQEMVTLRFGLLALRNGKLPEGMLPNGHANENYPGMSAMDIAHYAAELHKELVRA
jgi:hypothetical protein